MKRSAVVWLFLVVLLGLSQAAFAAAVWTTNWDGTMVDGNIYQQKAPPPTTPPGPPTSPFLNGGPNLFSQNGSWLAAGTPENPIWYVFMVTEPAGKTKLSTDDISQRTFGIAVDPQTGRKYIIYNGNHITWKDFLTDIKTIALYPFLDTPNNGGEYKLWVMPLAYYDPGNPASNFGFIPRYSKTDNFKVRKLASVWGEKKDQNGDPVPGLHIILYKLQGKGSTASYARIADTVTNAAGQFSFVGLPAAKYCVNEDLLGTDNPSAGLNPIDYSSWTRISPSGPIYFTIGKGNIGNKSGPGVPIYIGCFVNANVPAKGSICGTKLLYGTDTPLSGWTMTLEMKDEGGNWIPAVDYDGNLVAPQVTDENGNYCFNNLRVDRTYRVLEEQKDGWLQVGPNMGSVEEILWPSASPSVGVDPNTADVTITAVSGCFIVNFGYATNCEITVTALNFVNKLACLTVEKKTDNGTPVVGWEFALFEANGVTPATDAFGNAVPHIFTGSNGKACFENLLGRNYVVKEIMRPGWRACGLVSVPVTVLPGQDCEDTVITFTNHIICIGHTPGFWRNHDVGQAGVNHPTLTEFAMLLKGTIADVGTDAENIALADSILDKWDNAPGDEVGHLAAFLLANQLTLNLTVHPELPYSNTASLIPECTLPGITGTLGDWIAEAVAIYNANGVGYTREYITYVAGILDAFCNANNP